MAISKIVKKNEVDNLFWNTVELRCLSTDSKPTDVPNGSVLLEMDTGKVFIFNGANSTWIEL